MLPRGAQVVAVQVERVGEPEVVDDRRQVGDDLRGGDVAIAFDRLCEAASVFTPFPRGHAARVDRLHRVALRRPEQPSQHVPGPFGLVPLEQVEQQFVVCQQHAGGFVEDRDIGKLLVRLPSRQGRHGRLVDRRVAQPGVQIAGGERRGRHAGNAGPQCGRVDQLGRLPVVLGCHGPGQVQRPASRMRVPIHPAGKDDHPRRIDGARSRLPARLDHAARVDPDIPHLAVDAVGRVVDFSTGDSQHGFGLSVRAGFHFSCSPKRQRGAALPLANASHLQTVPPWLHCGLDFPANAAEHFLGGWVRRFCRGYERQRHAVHSIGSAGGANTGNGRGDMHPG